MNGTFFRNPNFSEEIESKNDYILLKDNISKKVKVYILFNEENKTFSGILEDIRDESIILSDPSTGNWFFIPFRFLYYIEFEEKVTL